MAQGMCVCLLSEMSFREFVHWLQGSGNHDRDNGKGGEEQAEEHPDSKRCRVDDFSQAQSVRQESPQGTVEAKLGDRQAPEWWGYAYINTHT